MSAAEPIDRPFYVPDAAQRRRWLDQAARCAPVLVEIPCSPVALVEPVADPSCWQGWAMRRTGVPADLAARRLRRGDRVHLDFGEHLVGHLELRLSSAGNPPDSPGRFRVYVSETPAEVADPDTPSPAQLSHAWFQDERVTVDTLPAVVRMPRRTAGRYVMIQVLDTSGGWQLVIDDARIIYTGAVPPELPAAGAALPPALRAIDEVSLRTLRGCLQTVLEDGPKRDRRLWSGDLRLQALVDGVSFKQTALVQRCLLLFAAGVRASDGVLPACVFERPEPHPAADVILDYALLFPAILRDLAGRADADRGLIRELLPIARRQLDIGLGFVGAEGLMVPPAGWWTFVDWAPGLDKQAALHGVMVYGLNEFIRLAAEFDRGDLAADLPPIAVRLTASARERLWDARRRVVVSGPEHQLAWAGPAWFTLAGIISGAEAGDALENAMGSAEAIRPGGPYLMHHVVHALWLSGRHERARALIQQFWGGMVERGADTFWEVYDPAKPEWSPYGDARLNSACHAWSCTPAWFLRGGAGPG